MKYIFIPYPLMSLAQSYILLLCFINNNTTPSKNFSSVHYLESRVSGKKRNGSGNVCGGNEGHDGDHSKTSVVQFAALAELHLVGILGGEVDGGEDDRGQVASLGVVHSRSFRDDLREEDCEVDLGLACNIIYNKIHDSHFENPMISRIIYSQNCNFYSLHRFVSNKCRKQVQYSQYSKHSHTQKRTFIRNRRPGIQRLHGAQTFETDIVAEHTGEMHTGTLNEVSSGGKHGNAGMLQLSSTEPGEGAVRSQSGEAQRIVSREGKCGAWHIIDGIERSDRLLADRGRCECSSRGEQGGEAGGELHFQIGVVCCWWLIVCYPNVLLKKTMFSIACGSSLR